MKTCNRCKLNKESKEFKSRKNGLDSYCIPCRKTYSTEYWRKTKDRRSIKRKVTKAAVMDRNAKYVANYLKSHPCVDCGEKNIIVLEFDHLENKVGGISDMISTNPTSLSKLKTEIDKCVVRCANCHRIKTAKERNFRILKFI